jgi:hypothetical protein
MRVYQITIKNKKGHANYYAVTGLFKAFGIAIIECLKLRRLDVKIEDITDLL